MSNSATSPRSIIYPGDPLPIPDDMLKKIIEWADKLRGAKLGAIATHVNETVRQIGQIAGDFPKLGTLIDSWSRGAVGPMAEAKQAVANADQSARLAALGCRHAQGPLFGKPIDADSVPSLLTASNSVPLAA